MVSMTNMITTCIADSVEAFFDIWMIGENFLKEATLSLRSIQKATKRK